MKTFDGKLIIDRTPVDEWGMLVVDDAIRQKCLDLITSDEVVRRIRLYLDNM